MNFINNSLITIIISLITFGCDTSKVIYLKNSLSEPVNITVRSQNNINYVDSLAYSPTLIINESLKNKGSLTEFTETIPVSNIDSITYQLELPGTSTVMLLPGGLGPNIDFFVINSQHGTDSVFIHNSNKQDLKPVHNLTLTHQEGFGQWIFEIEQ